MRVLRIKPRGQWVAYAFGAHCHLCSAETYLALSLAARQRRMTNSARTAHEARALFMRLLAEAMSGAPKKKKKKKKKRTEISSSGYAVRTLDAALWCVYHAKTFEEPLVLAVNLGEDVDNVGAVTGHLAGALWGEDKHTNSMARKARLAWADRGQSDGTHESGPALGRPL